MSGFVSPIRRHPLVAVFVLAYPVAWGFWPFGSFGAFGPLVAALIVIPLTRGRAGLREWGARLIRWRVGWIWYVVPLGLPLAVHLVTAGLTVAAGGEVRPLTFSSVTAALLVFALRLVNPTGVWCAVAVGLVAADRSAWRPPAPGPTRRPPILLAERTP